MRRLSVESWAKIGITVQLLALVRTLAEYFRLAHLYGVSLKLEQVSPYITGALITSLFCDLAVGLFFFRRYALALGVSGTTVLVLLAYKIYAIRG
jgi:hypothetical protein